MDYTLVGEKMRQKRILKGLSQSKLAELAGLSPNYYSSLERGEYKGRLETYFNVANALGVSLDTLLEDVYGSHPEAYFSLIMKKLKNMTPQQRQLVLDCIDTISNYNVQGKLNKK